MGAYGRPRMHQVQEAVSRTLRSAVTTKRERCQPGSVLSNKFGLLLQNLFRDLIEANTIRHSERQRVLVISRPVEFRFTF
jgi:hypothetical protein